MRVESNLGKK